jgi:hypothetical protein
VRTPKGLPSSAVRARSPSPSVVIERIVSGLWQHCYCFAEKQEEGLFATCSFSMGDQVLSATKSISTRMLLSVEPTVVRAGKGSTMRAR